MERLATQHTSAHEDHLNAFAVGDLESDRDRLVDQLAECPDCLALAYKLATWVSPLEHSATFKRMDSLLSDVMGKLSEQDRSSDAAPTHAETGQGAQVIVLGQRPKLTQNYTLWALAATVIVLLGGLAIYRMAIVSGPGERTMGQKVVPQVSVVSNEVLGNPEEQTADGTSIEVSLRETVRMSARMVHPISLPMVITLWAETPTQIAAVWSTTLDNTGLVAANEGKTVTLHLKTAGRHERTGVIATVLRDNVTVSVPAALFSDQNTSVTLWWAVSETNLTDVDRKELSGLSETTISATSLHHVVLMVGPTRVQLR